MKTWVRAFEEAGAKGQKMGGFACFNDVMHVEGVFSTQGSVNDKW